MATRAEFTGRRMLKRESAEQHPCGLIDGITSVAAKGWLGNRVGPGSLSGMCG